MTADRGNPEGARPRPRYPGSFLQAFREAAESLGWKVTAWHDGGVTCVDPAGEEQTVGLENVYRRARQADRAEWPDIVRAFLGNVDTGQYKDVVGSGLAEVAGRLLPRVGRPFKAHGVDTRPWARPLGETGLAVNLVIDFPHSMAYVNEDQVEESGRPADEWVGQALDNLRAHTPADCVHAIHEESGLRVCEAGDSYDSS